MGNALLTIKNCRQKPGQSVRELATHLQNQWDDIPWLTEQAMAWDLVNALDPTLRA